MRVNLKKDKPKVPGINFTYFTISIIIIVFILIGAFHYYRIYNQYNSYKNKLNNLNNRIDILEQKRKEYTHLKEKIDQLSQNKVPENDFLWDQLLIILGKETPKNVMIKRLRVNNLSVTIEGITDDSENITEFVSGLYESKLFNNLEIERIIKQNEQELDYIIKGKLISLNKGEE